MVQKIPGVVALVLPFLSIPVAAEEPWEPFPPVPFVNDFGGVGLIQTPTARFAPDGQLFVGGNRVSPYERYFVTLQPVPWAEATLRYSSVGNRLYSNVPEFSGDQSYKDRGFDLKLRVFDEGRIRPALALGVRDFLGTGLFSSEYIVANKRFGPADISLGMGWGNLATRGTLKNPFLSLSESFRDRGRFTAGGGSLNNVYFKGARVGLFGGIRYDLPVKGLSFKAEYDPNNYQFEALDNRFPVAAPVNVGLDYAVTSWFHVGAAFERGNRLGLRLVLTNNLARQSGPPKADPPPPPFPDSRGSLVPAGARPAPTVDAPPLPPAATPIEALGLQVAQALATQGSTLFSADLAAPRATLYVAQGRYIDMARGLGRISRAAFSVLPTDYTAVRVVLVENGVETVAATVFRDALARSLEGLNGSTDELLASTEITAPPLALDEAEFQAPVTRAPPSFLYSVRPALRTTLGRPEQFILYQLWVKLNGFVEIKRGLNVTGSLGINVIDNFDQLRQVSDSQLPAVRSDIKEYLQEGRTAITHLQADYAFNIAPNLYGHVYGGLLEEMFGGVGGEVVYRRHDQPWALGLDVAWVKQRDFDQFFGFQKYNTFTGFLTGQYTFADEQITGRVKAGRYLAKDWGATFELQRRFKSGVTAGAFATFTDVSAAEFGEGRFDKGIYITIPIDLLFTRHTRGGIGLLWRPLLRDGGQAVVNRQSLLAVTDNATGLALRRDWQGITD